MLIKHKKLTIRNAVATDAEQLCNWWNDGEVMAHAGFPSGLNTTAEAVCAELLHDSDSSHRRHIIEFAGKAIGEMSYRNQGNETAEIGIKICDFNYQDQGLGTTILSLFVDALFNKYGYKRIILDTSTNNKRAQHVYQQKLGFKIVGTRQ